MPIITINYQMSEGYGGLPLWSTWGWMTWDPNTRVIVEKDYVPEDRVKIVALPYSRNIVAMRTDGQPLTLVSITPPGMTPIVACLKLGPIQYGLATPAQVTGTYSGSRLCEWSCRIQQTTP